MLKKILNRLKKIAIKKVPVYIQREKNSILNERCAIILGGTGGIGFCIADKFLEAGSTVILASRSQEKLNYSYNKLHERYSNVFIYSMDLNKVDNFNDDLRQMEIQVGRKIDILVNCAGVNSSQTFPEISSDEYDLVMSSNLKGIVFFTQVFSKYLIKNKIKGNILNIGSSSGCRPAISSYMMSKWALRGFTLGIAKTLIKYNIVVNGIAPGPTATNMITNDITNLTGPKNDAKRMVTVDEIASMAVRLVSEQCRMIVGEMINITGGSGTLTFDDIKYN